MFDDKKKAKKVKLSFNDKIESALDLVRPTIGLDGGKVELVEADEKEGIVKVKLAGACQHCPMAAQTLQYVVERAVKENVRGVKEVLAV